jgi:hypothetical protein
LDHFWDPLTGLDPFLKTQITGCIGISGSRFWTRFGAVLVTIFGCQIPTRKWHFWGRKLYSSKMAQKNIKKDPKMTTKWVPKKEPKIDEKWTKKNEGNKSLLTHT